MQPKENDSHLLEELFKKHGDNFERALNEYISIILSRNHK